MGEEHTSGAEENAATSDRRSMIKKTIVGAGAVGVVWAAPKVDGLSLRPDYAAAASAGGTPFNFTMGPILGNSYAQTLPFAGGNVTGTWSGTGTPLTLNFTGGPNCGFTAINAVNNTSLDDFSNGAAPVINATQVVVDFYGQSDLQPPGGNISGVITCT